MGWRFRKSIKLLSGVRLNLSKNGVSISLGRNGARVTINKNGRVTKTYGIAGTGFSYSISEDLKECLSPKNNFSNGKREYKKANDNNQRYCINTMIQNNSFDKWGKDFVFRFISDKILSVRFSADFSKSDISVQNIGELSDSLCIKAYSLARYLFDCILVSNIIISIKYNFKFVLSVNFQRDKLCGNDFDSYAPMDIIRCFPYRSCFEYGVDAQEIIPLDKRMAQG